MVAHKRSEHAEGEETQNEVTGSVFVKAAEVCAAVEETAHICRREHFKV